MNTHIRKALAGIALAILGGCSATSGLKSSNLAPITREEAIGTWALTDAQNELFDVVIARDGSAVDTWWKGTDGAKGERGRWEMVDGKIDLRYSSGWRDVISRSQLGFHKVSYAPGLAPGSGPSKEPSNDGQAVRVTGERLGFTGVWLIPGALPGQNYDLYYALRSDGMAMKSIDTMRQGTWVMDGPVARVYFADGWRSTIETLEDGKYFCKSWKPGTPATEMPTGSGTATKVAK